MSYNPRPPQQQQRHMTPEAFMALLDTVKPKGNASFDNLEGIVRTLFNISRLCSMGNPQVGTSALKLNLVGQSAGWTIEVPDGTITLVAQFTPNQEEAPTHDASKPFEFPNAGSAEGSNS